MRTEQQKEMSEQIAEFTGLDVKHSKITSSGGIVIHRITLSAGKNRLCLTHEERVGVEELFTRVYEDFTLYSKTHFISKETIVLEFHHK